MDEFINYQSKWVNVTCWFVKLFSSNSFWWIIPSFASWKQRFIYFCCTYSKIANFKNDLFLLFEYQYIVQCKIPMQNSLFAHFSTPLSQWSKCFNVFRRKSMLITIEMLCYIFSSWPSFAAKFHQWVNNIIISSNSIEPDNIWMIDHRESPNFSLKCIKSSPSLLINFDFLNSHWYLNSIIIPYHLFNYSLKSFSKNDWPISDHQ